MKFTKMHGLGNDYIFINCFDEVVSRPEKLARELCQTHFGVSADGLVLIKPSNNADFAMQMFNIDGSEAQMCGNAIRCLGKYVYERGLTQKTELEIETLAGMRSLSLSIDGAKVLRACADMGMPIFTPSKIPVNLPGDMVRNQRIQVLGESYFISCVSMGNPHCIIPVKDPELIDIEKLGPCFEHHEIFPERCNISFISAKRRDQIMMRVWERGCGETLACGTGACAALVCAVMLGLCDRNAQVSLRGGNLEVSWNAANNHVYQSGPAAFVFEGETLIS